MLLKLMRYQCTFTESTISLEDYVKHMTKDQNKIYFLFSPKRDTGMNSPYMESFRDSETPVLLVDHHVDEMCFKNIDNFKGYKFINIESHFDEISKDVKSKVEIDSTRGLPEDDITPFCLWLKVFASSISFSRMNWLIVSAKSLCPKGSRIHLP